MTLAYLDKVLGLLRGVEPLYFFYAVLLYFVMTALYALRLQIILLRLGIRISFFDSFVANQLSVAFNNLTPSFRVVGEGARAGYVYLRVGGRLVGVLAAIVFDKIVEALPLVALAVIVLPESLSTTSSAIYTLLAIGISITGIIVAVLYWDRIVNWLIEKARKRGYHIKVSGLERRALETLMRDKLLVAIGIAISFAAWLVLALRLYLVALSIGWRVRFYDAVLLTVAYTVISIFTITPGGVGVIEASLTGLFMALGAPADKALAASLVERLISYGIGTAAGIILGLVTGGWELWRRMRRRPRGAQGKNEAYP